jgi:polysaccharide export outer membrane protein
MDRMSLLKQATLAGAFFGGACVVAVPLASAQSEPAAPPSAAADQSVPPAARPPAPAPAATAVRAAAPATQAPVATPYRINPGDELEIYVWGEERLQRTVRVLPDGTLAFPLVGQVVVQGMLPHDLETTISERLRDQYRGQVPQVTVSVKSPSGMVFSVMGKVRSPGTFTPGRYTTVLEALSLAGGPAEFANLDSVVLLRKQGDRLVPLRLRLGSLFKSGLESADVAQANQRIEPGDTIIVP